MKKTILFKTTFLISLKTTMLFLLCAFINNQSATSQIRRASAEQIRLDRDICIYKPAPNPVRSYIPVSLTTKERMTRDTEASCSTFNVTYTGFTTEAEAAFQFAVDIWANTLTSTVPITIDADFGPLSSGVLGGAGPYTFIGLTGGSLPETTYFPIALANSLLGSDQRPADPDILATFSSTYGNFYFGTDGNPGSGEIDFVTVVLHEIGHGLGIVGFGGEELDMDDNPTGLGEIRFGGFASIWDYYIENGSGSDILSFTDPSVALLDQFEGGDLFSNGSETTSQNGGINPETFAPNPFQSGSSYSHWDETTYPAGNANSLMTPFVAPGEAIHDPGLVTLGFMNDMLWSVCNDLLSTQDIKKESLFAFYPNPVNDDITFEAINVIQKITVYNILGQKIIQSSPKRMDSKMNFSELTSGIYLIEVSINNTSETVRIVKN